MKKYDWRRRRGRRITHGGGRFRPQSSMAVYKYTLSEEQEAIKEALNWVLKETRKEPGLPLEEVAESIKRVYDKSEIKQILNFFKK